MHSDTRLRDGAAKREVRFLLEHRTHIDMGNIDNILNRYELEVRRATVERIRAALPSSPPWLIARADMIAILDAELSASGETDSQAAAAREAL